MAFVQETRNATSRLRSRSSGLPRGRVTEIQRSRMLAAALEAVEEVGYARMTVAQVIGRAKVSRKTFYDVFADREDCFLAALEQAVSQVGKLVREAYDGGAHGATACAPASPSCSCSSTRSLRWRGCVSSRRSAPGRACSNAVRELLEELAEVVDRGRFVTNAVREPPEVAAEGVVGAVFAVLHTRALEDGGERFAELLGSLMNIVVLPYLGARAASRELSRPAPEPRRGEDACARSRAEPRPDGRLEHAPDLSNGARAGRDRRAPRREQSRDRRALRRSRPGPDLKAARAARAPGARRKHGRGPGEGWIERLASDAARRARRAGDSPALSEPSTVIRRSGRSGVGVRLSRCFAFCCGDCSVCSPCCAACALVGVVSRWRPGQALRGRGARFGPCRSPGHLLREGLERARLALLGAIVALLQRCARALAHAGRATCSARPIAAAVGEAVRPTAHRAVSHRQGERGGGRADVRGAAQAPAAALVAAPDCRVSRRSRWRSTTGSKRSGAGVRRHIALDGAELSGWI